MGPWGVGGGGSVRGFGSLIRSWPASLITLAALLHITSALPEVIKLGKNFLQCVLATLSSTSINPFSLVKILHKT